MTIKCRYKRPQNTESELMEHLVKENTIGKTSNNFDFAAAVTQFGLLLLNSDYKCDANFETVLALAKKSQGHDKEGYRKEFIELVEKAIEITPQE